MTTPNSPLPKFENPPVVETVFGVHFKPVADFDVAHRVLFWASLRDDFPKLEEKVPIDEIVEEFGDDAPSHGVPIRWQVSDAPPSPRLWAKSKDDRHTIQIQQDALLVNWERSLADSKPYWPFEERRKDFADRLQQLSTYFEESGIGSVCPTSCFAKYINHVEYDSAGEFPSAVANLLTFWRNETSDDWLPPIEHGSVNLAFLMPDQRGRLHVTVVPGVRRSDNKRILRMDLTARGVPQSQTTESVLAWIDLGHEWIVRGFCSITPPELHQVWRRVS